MKSGRFLLIKVGEGGSHFFGRMTCSSFYVTTFLNGLLLGTFSYSVGGGVTDSWENIYIYTYIMESRLAISFGKVADRERKHPGEEASGHLGASGK